MENFLEDENGYFKSVIKDALDDLKNNGQAYAFYQEQVDEIVKAYQNELKNRRKRWYLLLDRYKTICYYLNNKGGVRKWN